MCEKSADCDSSRLTWLIGWLRSPVPDTSFDCDNENLAMQPKYAGVVANMSSILRAGWRAQLP